jgi:hypothetical protein
MKTGYKVIKNTISAATAELLCLQFEIRRNAIYYEKGLNPFDEDKLFEFGDEQVVRSFAQYGFVGFEGLMLQLMPVVEEATGKRLLPAYTYGRIYYNGAVMYKHIDRPSCEYSATMTLSVDEKPWDIWMTDLKGVAKPLSLGVGDMCVYQGGKLEHWREEYQGEKQIQVFLHYVEADGPNKAHAYDKRPMLGLKKEET